MTSKERYQAFLDSAYPFAPFKFKGMVDIKRDPWPLPAIKCQVCGNSRLRYLCRCIDRNGDTWYIGRDCHTKLEERYEEEHK